MSAASTEPHQDPIDTAEADARVCRQLLREMIDIGMEFVRELRPSAQPDNTAPEPAPAAARSKAADYDRFTRSIRRAMRLLEHLHRRPAAPASPTDSAHKRIAARKRILRDVEDEIYTAAKPERAERLHTELLDRLDSPDLEHEIATRPVAEIVTDIRRDLGLNRPDIIPVRHKRRGPDEIAVLDARAALPPGSKAGAIPSASPPFSEIEPEPDGPPPDLSKVPDSVLELFASFHGTS